jgi:hypothetical protein
MRTGTVIHRLPQFLFGSKVALRGLNGGVPEQKLDLFEFTSALVTEACTAATQIVRCDMVDAGITGTPSYDVPYDVDGYSRFLTAPVLPKSPKDSAFLDSRG